MKNLKMIMLSSTMILFVGIGFAQSKSRVIIESPKNVNNPNNSEVYRMTCVRGEGGWAMGCYHIGVVCTNGNGLSVSVHVKSCLDRISSNFPDINGVPKFKLLDLEISFMENQQNLDAINLLKYKNGNYEVLDEVIQENDEEILIIKPGVYKVSNSKMHVLMHEKLD